MLPWANTNGKNTNWCRAHFIAPKFVCDAISLHETKAMNNFIQTVKSSRLAIVQTSYIIKMRWVILFVASRGKAYEARCWLKYHFGFISLRTFNASSTNKLSNRRISTSKSSCEAHRHDFRYVFTLFLAHARHFRALIGTYALVLMRLYIIFIQARYRSSPLPWTICYHTSQH